jgi:uncharacterized zinc-type alcohol dehydrogenase-like protein
MTTAKAYAATSATAPLSPYQFERRAVGPHDVQIEIAYCGICHSDLHQVRNEWGNSTYPMVPGHEIVGKVTAVGAHVKGFKIGDLAGVGCLVDSCRTCPSCQRQLEQFCQKGAAFSYNSTEMDRKTITQGGYSSSIVTDEAFVLKISPKLDLAAAAPLLCAGITTYSPLSRYHTKKGDKVGVVGLGGLGHMAVKIAAAMGAEVTVLTTSSAKVEDARRFGAKTVIVNEPGADLSKFKRSLDFILDTAPYRHDLERIIPLLKLDATLCMVGAGKIVEPHQIGPFSLLHNRNSFASSQIGGIRETQELVGFCALHGIRPTITKISREKIDDAWTKVVDKAARYRFVIDLAAA